MPYARCSRCATRRTLARQPAEYVRIPRCKHCGHNKYRIDRYRAKFERGPKPTCHPGRCGCSMYAFPHRRGSGFCAFNDKVTIEMLAAREGVEIGGHAQQEFQPCPF